VAADVIEACNSSAGGAFFLKAESLPTNPDQQREQLVRRLAAEDSAIDLIGMDVVWTAEFGQAGWVTPFEDGELTNVGSEDKVLKGPFESAQYDGKQYGAPLNSNTRLLWYRKSMLGDTPVPQTWDELLDAADAKGTKIQETGKRAESLMVFFNALVESAGTSIITTEGGESTVALDRAATVRRSRSWAATPTPRPPPQPCPSLGEETQPPGFESTQSDSTFMINCRTSTPRARGRRGAGADYGVAPYPRVDPSKPAAAPLGGYNLGISATPTTARAAVAAINCLTEPEQQRTIAIGGRTSLELRELAQGPGDHREAAVPAGDDRAARERRAAPGHPQSTTTSPSPSPGAAPRWTASRTPRRRTTSSATCWSGPQQPAVL
jgi:multiple sugar transport system substrate-binding protein